MNYPQKRLAFFIMLASFTLNVFLGTMFLCTLTASCGAPEDLRIDPAFVKYVKEFEAYYGYEIDNMEMRFQTIPEPETLAYCYIDYAQGLKIMVVDPEYWQMATETRREITIFHELGHCQLLRNHNNDYTQIKDFEIPKSIMHSHPGNIPALHYLVNRRQYINELFCNSVIRSQAACL